MTKIGEQPNIQKLIDQLSSSISTERLDGVTGLASLAFQARARGAARTRGTISRAAPTRLHEEGVLIAMKGALSDSHLEVRRSLAFALGELGNETAVSILGTLVQTEPESVVRAEAVDALGKIGGSQAVQQIRAILSRDSSVEVRLRAIRALFALACTEPGASDEVMDALQQHAQVESSDIVRNQIGFLLNKLKA